MQGLRKDIDAVGRFVAWDGRKIEATWWDLAKARELGMM
jgi:hypothetical protein